jgi:hypothetical protein
MDALGLTQLPNPSKLEVGKLLEEQELEQMWDSLCVYQSDGHQQHH